MQIDISGGDMVQFKSPSPGRDRRFPRGLCIVQHNVRWEPVRATGGRERCKDEVYVRNID